jgi:hypothetical protein
MMETNITASRSRRSILLIIFVTFLTVVSVPIISTAAGVSETTPEETASKTHTLVIKTVGETVTYRATASGDIHFVTQEKHDSRTMGSGVSGNLGGVPWDPTNDSKDIIKYTGYIQGFQFRGEDIRVFLDGERISPEVLAAQHIQISYPKTHSGNNPQPIQYRITMTGRAALGEGTEKNDKANRIIIRGQISNDSDSFYFTGDINPGSVTISGPARIRINGQKSEVFIQNDPKTPTPTPRQTSTPTPTPILTTTLSTETDSRPMSTDIHTSTPTTTTVANTTGSLPSGGSSSPSSSGNGFLSGLIGGIVVVGALMFAVFKYFGPKQRRW